MSIFEILDIEKDELELYPEDTVEVLDVEGFIEHYSKESNVYDNIIEHGMFYQGRLFFQLVSSWKQGDNHSYILLGDQGFYDYFGDDVFNKVEKTYLDGSMFRDFFESTHDVWLDGDEEEGIKPCINEKDYEDLGEILSMKFEDGWVSFEELSEEEQNYYWDLIESAKENNL